MADYEDAGGLGGHFRGLEARMAEMVGRCKRVGPNSVEVRSVGRELRTIKRIARIPVVLFTLAKSIDSYE